MKKNLGTIIGGGIIVVGLVVAGAGFAKSGEGEVQVGTIRIENQVEADFPALAKITWEQAAQKALAEVQGKILKNELEAENGFLVYGIEVVTADKAIMKVMVDAGTGKVLASEVDEADKHDNDRDEEE